MRTFFPIKTGIFIDRENFVSSLDNYKKRWPAKRNSTSELTLLELWPCTYHALARIYFNSHYERRVAMVLKKLFPITIGKNWETGKGRTIKISRRKYKKKTGGIWVLKREKFIVRVRIVRFSMFHEILCPR
jgi:hypothetical protein